MQNLIPCRFHVEVKTVLKTEGLRATKQRLDIWDELCSTDNHRDIESILSDKKSENSLFKDESNSAELKLNCDSSLKYPTEEYSLFFSNFLE